MSSKISLVRATMADRPRLANFLSDNFYPYPPLYISWEDTNDDDVDFFLRTLTQGRTLLAVEGEDLLGVAINGDITSEEYKHRVKLLQEECTCEADTTFMEFWTHAEKAAGFWTEGEPTTALDLEILCVSVAARGRGVGLALIEGSRQLAREDGYQLFRMDCISYHAARLAEKAGMTCVYTLPYEDYRNEKGVKVFKAREPHYELKTFKERL